MACLPPMYSVALHISPSPPHTSNLERVDGGNSDPPDKKSPPPFSLSHPLVRPIAATELVGDVRQVHVVVIIIDEV